MQQASEANEIETDVVVVGAGPGGAVLANLLARSGVRTMLVERHPTLDREFRGYFFQPAVLRIFDEMGILPDVRRIPHEDVDAFEFVDHGRTLFRVDFSGLPAPYDHGLNLPQPPLLEQLIQDAAKRPGFSYHPGTAAKALLKDDAGRVRGVELKRGTQTLHVASRVVVGADGRFSTIRKLAGIEEDEEDVPLDLLWFDVPPIVSPDARLRLRIEDAGMLIYIPMGEGRMQIGWIIRKGSYPELKKRGLDALVAEIAAVDASVGAHLAAELKAPGQVSVLDIKASMAREWVRDGLLLLGDAAHTSSPFSGQGNSLAIQDAVVAHDILVRSLRASPPGPLPAKALRLFEDDRRPAVASIKRIQRMQARLVSSQSRAVAWLRRALLPLARHTPVFRIMRDRIALGARPVRVATEHFVA